MFSSGLWRKLQICPRPSSYWNKHCHYLNQINNFLIGSLGESPNVNVTVRLLTGINTNIFNRVTPRVSAEESPNVSVRLFIGINTAKLFTGINTLAYSLGVVLGSLWRKIEMRPSEYIPEQRVNIITKQKTSLDFKPRSLRWKVQMRPSDYLLEKTLPIC